jgi:hypothetical protein
MLSIPAKVIEAWNDVVERIDLHRADRRADVVSYLEARDNPFHRGLSSGRRLLRQRIGHIQASAIKLEKFARQDVPGYPVVALDAQGKQCLAQGDLVGCLVQAVQDQGLPIIGSGKVLL